ncbi:MAG: hypothetical protein ACW99G_07655 [Candidatus Thorarchaeota archaeon]|jgi:hypothetical protein
MEDRLTHYQKLKLQAIIPRKKAIVSDGDLRMSLVTLKNAQSVLGFHISRIEKELKKRGVSKYIIHQSRDT